MPPRQTGQWRQITSGGGETARAFVPLPFPIEPAISIDGSLRDKLDAAHLSLGRLDSVSSLLPTNRLFLNGYVRREAVISSQIEGTQSSLSDLLLFEAGEIPGVPLDDVVEVSSCVAALEHGLRRISDGFPLSNRLIREIHGVLLAHGRGRDKNPGEFRRSQNWIGGRRPGTAAFVPPPPDLVPDLMSNLERWLHDDPIRTPTLLKAACSHVQFQTIHPFLDGNGRIGRLLITLLFCVEKVLSDPLLYISLYLKQHRPTYYSLLTHVRETGDWEPWIAFFGDAVQSSAAGAVSMAQRLTALARADRERIKREAGRVASTALRIHHALLERPMQSASHLVEATTLSMPAVNKAVTALQTLDIVREVTGRRRSRVYSYAPYVAILGEGTEAI